MKKSTFKSKSSDKQESEYNETSAVQTDANTQRQSSPALSIFKQELEGKEQWVNLIGGEIIIKADRRPWKSHKGTSTTWTCMDKTKFDIYGYQKVDVHSANQTALKKCLDKIGKIEVGLTGYNYLNKVKQIIQECWGELK